MRLADHQFDAMTSISYNIGTRALAKPSFVRLITAAAFLIAEPAVILAWRKPPEILSRRTAEADQFARPDTTRLPQARSTDAAPIKIAA